MRRGRPDLGVSMLTSCADAAKSATSTTAPFAFARIGRAGVKQTIRREGAAPNERTDEHDGEHERKERRSRPGERSTGFEAAGKRHGQ